ncbi:hypothetical protein M9Y10_009934 [Tritrichomonas musculus]|uniref:DUF3447 domain-containing protein n=1 Tax=Tritrichomonas musculus TaxID=1915356 RepID=A0ABR2IPW6_9EUKA
MILNNFEMQFHFGAEILMSNSNIHLKPNIELLFNGISYQILKEAAISYSNIIREYFEENPGSQCILIDFKDSTFSNQDILNSFISNLFLWKPIVINSSNYDTLKSIASLFQIPSLEETLTHFQQIIEKKDDFFENKFPELFDNNRIEKILSNLNETNFEDLIDIIHAKDQPNIFAHELYKACISRPMKIELYIQFLTKLNFNFIKAFMNQMKNKMTMNNINDLKLFPYENRFIYHEIKKNNEILNPENFFKINFPNEVNFFDQSNDDSIEIAIKKDDIDMLQAITSTIEDINQIFIQSGKNERISFLHNGKMNLLEYSAFLGSIKCFKFLLLNHVAPSKRLPSYAVCSGDSEILRICSQQKECVFDGQALVNSIIYRQKSFFDWINSNQMKILINDLNNLINSDFAFVFDDINLFVKEISKSTINNELFHSIQLNNFYFAEILLHFQETSLSPQRNKYSKENVTPLIYAIMNDNTDIVELILSQNGYDINYKNSNGISALIAACKVNNNDIVSLLLKVKGIDINCVNRLNETPLQIAVMNENVDIVKLLLSQPKIQVDTQNTSVFYFINFYSTPLHDSCKIKNNEIFNLLLHNSLKLFSLKNSSHQTPLHCLVFNNNLNAFQIIKENSTFFESARNNINKKDATLKTPLEYACSDIDKYEMVKTLVDTFDNIDLNGDENDDFSPLYFACESNAINIVSFLLNQDKINVNKQNGYSKMTALVFACSKNFNEIVGLILKHPKVDVNLADCDGKTSLHFAIEQKNEEIVNLLLNENLTININIVDKYRLASPLHYACETGNLNIINALINFSQKSQKNKNSEEINSDRKISEEKVFDNQNSEEISNDRKISEEKVFDNQNSEEKNFDENNCEVKSDAIKIDSLEFNCKDKQNRTPLHIAVNSNFVDCVELLLKVPNIEINATDVNKIVPLHLACKNKNVDIVKLLVSCNEIDINAQDSSGFTALHYACESGNEEIVSILLNKEGILTDVEDQILLIIFFSYFGFHYFVFK